TAGQGAVGVDGELDRWLAASGAQAAQLDQQAFFEQVLNDIGDGLGGNSGAARDLCPAHMPVHADDFEDDAPVMGAIALRIGADDEAWAASLFFRIGQNSSRRQTHAPAKDYAGRDNNTSRLF